MAKKKGLKVSGNKVIEDEDATGGSRSGHYYNFLVKLVTLIISHCVLKLSQTIGKKVAKNKGKRVHLFRRAKRKILSYIKVLAELE